MIDNLSLLTTSLAILYVIVRAAKLDRMLSWIGGERPAAERQEGTAVRSWRDRGRVAAPPAAAAPSRSWRPR